MEKIDYRELASKLFCFGIIGALIVLIYKYALRILAPFLIAWLIAYLVFPLAKDISKRIKISRKICSFVLVLSFFSIIVSVVFLIGNRVLYELQNLLYTLDRSSDKISVYLTG